jgi:hypothetical protein
MHSTYSLILSTGYSNFKPCQCSAKIGVPTPKPIIILWLESISTVAADIAIVAGDLEKILAMEVPSLTLLVT